MHTTALQAIGLPISKLALHTACGGIEPATCMPVVFDVGTDNEELLQSPLYVGVRHRCVYSWLGLRLGRWWWWVGEGG
jgi:malic enzyme